MNLFYSNNSIATFTQSISIHLKMAKKLTITYEKEGRANFMKYSHDLKNYNKNPSGLNSLIFKNTQEFDY